VEPTAPPDCPADLAKRLDEYVGRFRDLLARQQALVAGVETLALAVNSVNVSGADVIVKAAALRGERYDVLQALATLVMDRRPLFQAITEVLTVRVTEAEENLAKAEAKGTSALKKSGWTPQSALAGRWGMYPEAEARQVAAEVRKMEAVGAAVGVLDDLKNALAQANRMIERTVADTNAVGAEVFRAWWALVGDLV
jgi:hypothetical protein